MGAQKSTQNSKDRKPQACYTCGSLYHLHRECPQKPTENTNDHQAKVADSKEEIEIDWLFFGSDGPVPPNDRTQWILDSGASSHMTNHSLVDYKESERPELVKLVTEEQLKQWVMDG